MFALLVQLKSQEIDTMAVGDEFQRERAALVEEHGRLGRERDLLRCNMEDMAAQLDIEQERNCSLVMGLKRVVFEVRAFLGESPTEWTTTGPSHSKCKRNSLGMSRGWVSQQVGYRQWKVWCIEGRGRGK